MEEKEKAKELIKKFEEISFEDWKNIKS